MNIAVYGSLRRSMPNDHLWRRVGYSVPCTMRGVALYDVGGPFPYAIEGGPDDLTHGDLVVIDDQDDAAEVLRALDILEGVESDHFVRTERHVESYDGWGVTAWVYLAHPSIVPALMAAGAPINHGDWVRSLHAHLTTN